MNSNLFKILRSTLGIFSLVFGINKFLHFLPLPELTGDAADYFTALSNSKTMILVGIVLVVSGLSLILNKYGALMALILMSISVNALLFHITLEPNGIIRTAILLILNIAVMVGYKDKYKALLS
ncbi:DoxX family protein [Winogradskyella eximia]|jgi:putative oxidoreductase|uniref:DoxX family protein n=1 Tax=Winogradskyella eximia TaxID=262006 RepID=UPI002490FC04|nr:DoxX family protein [Winogradskyella eximia]|tara:strand:+ start:4294 stop:4665 length:372 start_codon:yes stop_codon:yes gene_type:complete